MSESVNKSYPLERRFRNILKLRHSKLDETIWRTTAFPKVGTSAHRLIILCLANYHIYVQYVLHLGQVARSVMPPVLLMATCRRAYDGVEDVGITG